MPLRCGPVTPKPFSITRVALSDQIARDAIAFAEAELDRRYGGGTDREPLDEASFTPPLGSFFVATDSTGLLGGVGLRSIAPGVGEIKRLWVSDGARRRGLATTLMEAAEACAVQFGFHLVELETGPLQPEAVTLYLATGWERVDQLPIPVSKYPNAVRFLKRYYDSIN